MTQDADSWRAGRFKESVTGRCEFAEIKYVYIFLRENGLEGHNEEEAVGDYIKSKANRTSSCYVGKQRRWVKPYTLDLRLASSCCLDSELLALPRFTDGWLLFGIFQCPVFLQPLSQFFCKLIVNN
jgi:hypothetical protein